MPPTMGCCASSHMVHPQTWSPQFRTGFCCLTRQRRDDKLLELQGSSMPCQPASCNKGRMTREHLGCCSSFFKEVLCGNLLLYLLAPRLKFPIQLFPSAPIPVLIFSFSDGPILLASKSWSICPAFSAWASLFSQTSLSVLFILDLFFHFQPLPIPVPLCPTLLDQLILPLDLSPGHETNFLFQARQMEGLFTAQPVIQNNVTQAKEYTFLWSPLPFSHQPNCFKLNFPKQFKRTQMHRMGKTQHTVSV